VDTSLHPVTYLFIAGILAWLVFRLGTAIRIPLFVRWKDRLGRKEKFRTQRCSIRFDSEAITVTDLRTPEEKSVRIVWDDIVRLTLYKADLFSVDLICLHIKLRDDREFEVDEDMIGWSDLIDALPRQLPGCKQWEQWFQDVAHLAFASNPTEIYRREIVADTATSVQIEQR
jgi:hypothetical protein